MDWKPGLEVENEVVLLTVIQCKPVKWDGGAHLVTEWVIYQVSGEIDILYRAYGNGH